MCLDANVTNEINFAGPQKKKKKKKNIEGRARQSRQRQENWIIIAPPHALREFRRVNPDCPKDAGIYVTE